MPHHDVRYLRPEPHPLRAQIPYPDNHSEMIPFPGERSHMDSRHREQIDPSIYPNYEYDGSMYQHPRVTEVYD